MSRKDDPEGVLAWVEEKIAAISHIPVPNGEVQKRIKYHCSVGQGLAAVG